MSLFYFSATALFRIGQRNKQLHSKALKVAKTIGRIEVDYGDNSYQAIDVVKALESQNIIKRLGWINVIPLIFLNIIHNVT